MEATHITQRQYILFYFHYDAQPADYYIFFFFLIMRISLIAAEFAANE